jgi:hypothetical protein
MAKDKHGILLNKNNNVFLINLLKVSDENSFYLMTFKNNLLGF